MMHRLSIIQRQLITAAYQSPTIITSRKQVIAGFINNKGRWWSKDAKPDFFDYTKAIQTLVKSNEKGASKKAQQLLAELERRSEKDGEHHLKPDINLYNTVIKALTKSNEPDAPQTAESMLYHILLRYENKEHDVQPDATTFNNVIHAWANSGDNRGPE
jgi:hypothetical protein